jgi:hypothetical protein
MLRRLLVDATSVSLLLCIGTGMLSMRNRTSVELIALAHGSWLADSNAYSAGALSLGAADGRIAIGYGRWGFDFSHAGKIDGAFGGPRNPMQYRLRNPGELTVIHQQRSLGGAYSVLPDWHGFAWNAKSARTAAQWEESRGLTLAAWFVMLMTALLPLGCTVVAVRPSLYVARLRRWCGRSFYLPGRAARPRPAVA